VLFEMLTGDVPFKADNVVGVAMKHVNEKIPDVQKRRRDVSSALAAVVERATEKKPEKRYDDMNSMLAELENALEVEVARAGRSTGEATTVLDSVPRRQRIVTSRRVSIAGILLVLAGAAAALLIAGFKDDDRGRGSGGAEQPSGEEVTLVGAEDFDPFGTPPGSEHPELTELAIDGDSSTAWATEEYTETPVLEDAGKAGVGLILDAEEPVQGADLAISSTEGGWDAEIYAAESGPPDTFEGWGEPVGSVSGAAAEEVFELELPGPAQYYLIWLTRLAGSPGEYKVEISEARLTTG
jgi:serine/threonine-protein kinase